MSIEKWVPNDLLLFWLVMNVALHPGPESSSEENRQIDRIWSFYLIEDKPDEIFFLDQRNRANELLERYHALSKIDNAGAEFDEPMPHSEMPGVLRPSPYVAGDGSG
ncbi:hypothetical protein LTR27_002881 [Elasticomyces elasticus]|nr:hypothetical protein LTR27_002881 [Elasticomyces elasticus]